MVKRWSGSITLLLSAAVSLAGSAVLGQDDQPSSPTPPDQVATAVEGTSTLVGEAAAGMTTVDGAIVRVRDNVLITIEESSDPRASGRGVITLDFDAYPDADGRPGASQVRSGEMRLVNDAGAWSGRFAGSLANGAFVQTYWLEGSGAYEGFSYAVTAGGNGPVWRTRGLIFPGGLPVLDDGPRLPLDGPAIDLPTASAVATLARAGDARLGADHGVDRITQPRTAAGDVQP